MLKLKKPMMLGTKVYDGYTTVKLECDIRTRRIEASLGPVTEEIDYIRVAKEITRGTQREIRAPSLVATLTIEDKQENDPALARLFRKIQDVCEEIDSVLHANKDTPGGLSNLMHHDNEEEWSLDADLVPTPGKPFKNEGKGK